MAFERSRSMRVPAFVDEAALNEAITSTVMEALDHGLNCDGLEARIREVAHRRGFCSHEKIMLQPRGDACKPRWKIYTPMERFETYLPVALMDRIRLAAASHSPPVSVKDYVKAVLNSVVPND